MRVFDIKNSGFLLSLFILPTPGEEINWTMIAAFDVQYIEHSCAAAAVIFSSYRDPRPSFIFTKLLPVAADYIPGEFFRRELPCILGLYKTIRQDIDEIIVDGYVTLGDKPGLGRHLFESLDCKIPVIGVAKSKFKNSSGQEVYRGKSKRPLYITSAGINLKEAADRILSMHGAYRIPTLLKQVDILARNEARQAL